MHESNLTINETNDRVIQAGNSFLVVINLSNIKYRLYHVGMRARRDQLPSPFNWLTMPLSVRRDRRT